MATVNKFTKKAQNALNKSLQYARELGHTYIGSEHILMGLCCDGESVSCKILKNYKVTLENVRKSVLETSGIGIKSAVNCDDLTPRARQIIEDSGKFSRKYQNRLIGTEHLLLSLVSHNDCVGVKILESFSLQMDKIKDEIENFLESVSDKTDFEPADSNGRSGKKKANHCNIQGCPAISEYGRDLVAMAKEGKIDPVIGRDKEISRIIQILSRRSKNNPCLIGEPGVGKTAVVEGLAQKISSAEVPEMLREKHIITIDIPAMIAGAKYRGEFEDRMKNVMNESARNKDLILFIDEFHTIIGAGSAEGALDAANIIKPALARGEMQIIGATTISEYRKHIEKDGALERRFQPVEIEEPSKEDAVLILRGLREKYENHHGIKIKDSALTSAVELSCRYINDRFLPDKAIDLVDEACSKLCMDLYTMPPKLKELESKLSKLKEEKEKAILNQDFEKAALFRDEQIKVGQKYESAKNSWNKRANSANIEVSSEDIANVVTSWTKIPVNKLMESENEKLLNLEERLSKLVVGQSEAIKIVSNAIRRGRLKISDPCKPMGSFIFIGDTGVGKTELCKALALTLFGSKDAFVRFDMSEYMEKHSVSKLIGSPPGYVGYGEGGQLTDKVRARPYCVLLFDEIEKANSDVFNLFLQILDDGILTDSEGRKVNFRNTLIIMTSNIGSNFEKQGSKIGFSQLKSSDSVDIATEERRKAELKRIFRPEFLNRIDEIVTFNPLSMEDIEKITHMLIVEFADRIKNQGISIEITENAVKTVAKAGFDKSKGARPIKRAITKMIENEFAKAILQGEIKKGDKIKLNSDGDRIIFIKQ